MTDALKLTRDEFDVLSADHGVACPDCGDSALSLALPCRCPREWRFFNEETHDYICTIEGDSPAAAWVIFRATHRSLLWSVAKCYAGRIRHLNRWHHVCDLTVDNFEQFRALVGDFGFTDAVALEVWMGLDADLRLGLKRDSVRIAAMRYRAAVTGVAINESEGD